MPSMKAKKGNPFEKDCLYNLDKLKFKCKLLNDNYPGVDIIAEGENYGYVIECKNHKSFTWNELIKILKKTQENTEKLFPFDIKSEEVPYYSMVIFKPKRTPVLILSDYGDSPPFIMTFEDFFHTKFEKRPKGWRWYVKQ